MKLRYVLLVFVLVLASAWFFPPLAVVSGICLFLYVVFLLYRRMHRDQGVRRVRHGLLKASLVVKYGEKEGTGLYHRLVEELKKRGYV